MNKVTRPRKDTSARKRKHHPRGRNQPSGGNWLAKWMRLAILLRDRFTCAYCLRDLIKAGPYEIHVDHIDCRDNGGNDDPTNLITSCRSCNCKKQHKPCDKFATPEALRRIRRQRRLRLPEKLARMILTGKVPDPRASA